MSCCGASLRRRTRSTRSRAWSRQSSRRSCATLRDNAFAVGLREGQDAAALMAAGYAEQPRPAALGVQASVLGAQVRLGKIRRAVRRVLARPAGALALADAGLGESGQQPVAEEPAGQQAERGGSDAATDQMPSTDDAPDERSGEGRMEGASRGRQPRRGRFPQAGRSRRRSREAHAIAARLAQDHAHAADPPRPGAPARLSARSAPHHPPQHQPRRRADQSGQAAAQAKAAAARGAARRLRLDEHVHRRVPALHPWRARSVPRGRGVPVSHPPRPCLRRDEGEGRRRARSTGCR